MKQPVDYQLHYPYKRVFLTTVLVFLSTMLLLVSFVVNSVDTWRNRESLDIKDDYIMFQDELGELMETGVKLLQGYEAFLAMHDTFSMDESGEYLTYLLEDSMQYIRNIAIIEDTTIVYNFPLEGNESSIGVDLGQIVGQRENVLKTKNEMVKVFQGPVQLVQGGSGYINRVPIRDRYGNYWGQGSIVLNADVINAEILNIANQTDLSIVIYDNANQDNLIVGDSSILHEQPMLFVNENINNWAIYVVPAEGRADYTLRIILILGIGFILSLFISFAVYYFQKTHFDLIEVMAHDQLTGVYNRNYLETVQSQVTNAAKLNQTKYGLVHIDLDDFKSINDKYGHHKGDFVLESFGRTLSKINRREDLAFRVGGDEFMILLPLVESREELEFIKIRISHDIEKEFADDEILSQVAASIGIALYPEDGEDFDSVLKVADKKMYNEKADHKKISNT